MSMLASPIAYLAGSSLHVLDVRIATDEQADMDDGVVTTDGGS